MTETMPHAADAAPAGTTPSAAHTRPHAATRPHDTRRLRRVLAAVLMPIGPATIAVLRLFTQNDTTVGEQIAADPAGRWGWAVLGWVALFTLVPGIFAALHLMRRRAPRLTAWTAEILIPAYLGMTALAAMDAAAWAAISLGYAPDAASALGEEAFAAPTVIVPAAIFVIGHIVGTVMLGIVAIRTRRMPVWFGILFAASQLVHLTATFMMIPWLDFLGWGTTAVGMGVLGWRALRTPDDDWDLPPLPR